MEEIDLKQLFNIFWSKKTQIILIILIFMTIGFIYTIQFTKPMYSSSTTLVLTTSGDDKSNTNSTITTTDITINSKLVSTYSELVKSKNILREVNLNLGIEIDENSLRDNIVVKSVSNTELIEITVENENPDNAAQIANEIARVFTEKVKDIYNINNVQIVDEAEPSSVPSNINHIRDIAMFSCIGIVIVIVYVIIVNMLDTTIKTAEDIEVIYDIPVLASIPAIKKLETKGSRR